jgi:hypothetical protein
MNRNPLPGFGPAAPLTILDPIANSGVTPVLPATLPGVCGIGIQKKPKQSKGNAMVSLSEDQKKKKKTVDPCTTGGGGTEVPEPGTWLLMASGAVGLYWKARNKFSPLTSSQPR